MRGKNGMMSGFGMSEKKTDRIVHLSHIIFLPHAGVFHGNNMGFLNRLHKKNAEDSDSASSLFAEANLLNLTIPHERNTPFPPTLSKNHGERRMRTTDDGRRRRRWQRQ